MKLKLNLLNTSKHIGPYCLLLLFCLLLESCVSYKPQYTKKSKINVHTNAINQIDTSKIKHTLYLIGDAGNAPKDESTPLFNFLTEELNQANSQSTIVWLGDNIYPVGLPPENHADYKLGRHRIAMQLNTMNNYKGMVYFIPGNHDWYEYGLEGIRRQEKIIESQLSERDIHGKIDQSNYFLPDDGCGDIHYRKIFEGVGMILMDSNWFLSQAENRTDLDHCAFQTKISFLEQLAKTIQDHKDELLIISLHHPPYTYGSHAGYFPAKDNIFPLSQLKKWLYLPIPFAGTIANKMRSHISEQDNNHFLYQNLIDVIQSNLPKSKTHFIASGHEHSLQYIERDEISYIVSGAGSKNNPVKLGKGSLFSVGRKGYVKLIFETKDIILMQYIVLNQKETTTEILYQKYFNLSQI